MKFGQKGIDAYHHGLKSEDEKEQERKRENQQESKPIKTNPFVQKASFPRIDKKDFMPDNLSEKNDRTGKREGAGRKGQGSFQDGRAQPQKVSPSPSPSSSSSRGPGSFLKTASPQGLRKAAKFLLLMGKNEAAQVMRHLNPEEVEGLSREIAGIQRIHREEAHRILDEFGLIIDDIRLPKGGVETARAFLKTAFGEEKGDEYLYRAVPETKPHQFDFLEELEYAQIITLLRNEPVSVLSLVLSHLPSKTASEVIEALPPEKQTPTLHRMGRMEKVDSRVVERMEEVLRERVRKLGGMTDQEVDGRSALAGILRFLDPDQEQAILGDLDKENPDISTDIRERLFTVEDILDVAGEDLQTVLQEWEDKEVALLLKDKKEPFRRKILDNLSARRRIFIEDELSVMGPVPRKDVNTVTRKLLTELRLREQKGSLIRMSDREDVL